MLILGVVCGVVFRLRGCRLTNYILTLLLYQYQKAVDCGYAKALELEPGTTTKQLLTPVCLYVHVRD
jgi:hypothetical protein